MQTFLPYDDFAESARVLDRQRLGKQRVEGVQILRTLLGISDGWKSHPAVRMWAGHEGALYEYVVEVCAEWERRGYRNEKCAQHLADLLPLIPDGSWVRPSWLGHPVFHRSHRSKLLAKLPEHYRRYWPDDDDKLDYVWPN